MNVKRGEYNEIILDSLTTSTRKIVNNLIAAVQTADKVDEHGGWEFGCEFDRKGRGSALNWALYGVGRDLHSRRMLIVIQVRQFVRQRKNYYPEIKKSYFLLGRNEDDTVFAHPVQSRVVHYAVKAGNNVVRAVQDWIFGCDYSRVVRQGDIALVPLSRRPQADEAAETVVILQNSHRLTAGTILENGSLYALDPNLVHIPNTHPSFTLQGWYKVVLGKRSDFYRFAAPTID